MHHVIGVLVLFPIGAALTLFGLLLLFKPRALLGTQIALDRWTSLPSATFKGFRGPLAGSWDKPRDRVLETQEEFHEYWRSDEFWSSRGRRISYVLEGCFLTFSGASALFTAYLNLIEIA